MRVLLFGPYPFPNQPITGGVTAVVHALALGLARRTGVKVGVVSAHVGVADRVELGGDITIYRVPVPRYPRTRWHTRLRASLVDAAMSFRPHVIHAHGTGYYAAAALDSELPQIITVHGVVKMEAARSRVRHPKQWLAWQYDAALEKKVLTRARDCIAINPYVREAFSEHPHLVWHDVENPIDDAFFEIEPRPQEGRLLTLARVIPRKGIDVLIRAFARVAKRHPQAHLRIAGEIESMPKYVARCRKLVQGLGLIERVQFLGGLSAEETRVELAQAQALVLASRQETAPVAVAEGQAAGCPVIATAVGGLPYMVAHKENGLIVPPDDVVALAQALDHILAHPVQAQAWGQCARRVAQRHRLERVVDRTLALYETLL
ncbi:MAG: glycosyltransferase family 4 protein [Chloroflexi bacterium]|nr:glycosyltransferase family 4 protein [Chloroflexota bacterium]